MDRLDLSWITETLAIGGCFDCAASERLAREHGIGGVVDLRQEACDDVARLALHGIEHLHLPTEDHGPVTLEHLRAGVAFAGRVLDAGRRVLVHCQHGIGRSAVLALCVLVARGHAPLDALALAKSRRDLVSPSPSQYQAWASWLRAHRHAVPSFDEFAAIAYRHARRGA